MWASGAILSDCGAPHPPNMGPGIDPDGSGVDDRILLEGTVREGEAVRAGGTIE
ncbi:MAG TPA: hypothetical protein VE129_04830 [Thermoanaerobaculia bacterium]|nr:hypothetical protein [Thermoanaerobaculia bacterium]